MGGATVAHCTRNLPLYFRVARSPEGRNLETATRCTDE